MGEWEATKLDGQPFKGEVGQRCSKHDEHQGGLEQSQWYQGEDNAQDYLLPLAEVCMKIIDMTLISFRIGGEHCMHLLFSIPNA